MIGSGHLGESDLDLMEVVSILVVLDDWFGLAVDMLRRGSATGFNPCCFG